MSNLGWFTPSDRLGIPDLWTPAMIKTALWLDAADADTITLDGSGVSQWTDKSGNARHATQSTSGSMPIVTSKAINGLDAITFDGSDDFLTLGTALGRPSSYTVFAVSRPTKALSNLQAVFCSMISSGNSRDSCMSLSNDGGSVFWQYGNSGSTYRWGYGAAGFTLNVVAQHCLVHTNGTQDESVYRDGALLTNGSQDGTAATNAGTAQPTSIGRAGAYDGWYFGGDIAEVIVIVSAVSTSDRQKVEGYLAHKWGLAK